MEKRDKIKYGLSNVHYAVITNETSMEYETPKKIPGAVNLSLSAEGQSSNFYADNMAYHTTSSNNGFSGDLEIALIPDEFYTDVYGYEKDEETGLFIEIADKNPKPIALLFQFENDANSRRVVFYKVIPGRAAVNHQTKGESIEPQTDTIPITAVPVEIGGKKTARAVVPKDGKKYAEFFTAVVKPTLAG